MVRNALYLTWPNRANILPDIIFHGEQKLNQTACKSTKEGWPFSNITWSNQDALVANVT